MAQNKTSLIRALRLTDAISLVVGTVIGTGVFFKTAIMTQQLGRPTLVMLAWLAAGLLTMAGALAYAELGAMFPHAGGDYVYLSKAYGEAPAFLYGWMQFAVAGAGGMAAISTGFAIFVSALVPMGSAWMHKTFHVLGQEINWQLGWTQLVAVGGIVFFSVINCFGAALGGRVQSLLTVVKLLGIAVIVVGILLLSKGASWSHLSEGAGSTTLSGIPAFGAAMMAALCSGVIDTRSPSNAWNVSRGDRNARVSLCFAMTWIRRSGKISSSRLTTMVLCQLGDEAT